MLRLFVCLCLLTPLLGSGAASSAFDGRWRLDKERSSALDGWSDWDLVIKVTGDNVSLGYDMQWRTTKVSGANVLSLSKPTTVPNFFRVDRRHQALDPLKGKSSSARASWLDQQRTLRVEADVPIEVSQGPATVRLYSEFRLLEGDNALLLIELNSARPRPLVYRFTKVTTEK